MTAPSARSCSIDGCGGKHVARGLCKKHYGAAVRSGNLPQLLRPINRDLTCSIDRCPSPVQGRGLCVKHYNRLREHGDPNWDPPVRVIKLCWVDECGRPAHGRGMCVMHWNRWYIHGDPRLGALPITPKECTVEGCEKRPKSSRGLCSMHQARLDRTGTTTERPKPNRSISTGGYWVIRAEGHPVSRPSGWAYEHRVVLYDKIGAGPAECHWCATVIRWDATYPQHLDAVVADHLDEDKLNNDPANLVPSCAKCNLARSPRKRRAS